MRPLERKTPDTRHTAVARRVDRLERRYTIQGFHEAKIWMDADHPLAIEFPELAIVQAGNNQFDIPIPRSLNGFRLLEAEACISGAGSSALTVMIRNGGVTAAGALDMLTSPIVIDAGELCSMFSATPSVVDTANDEVDMGEHLWVCVLTDGGGTATGLSVMLWYIE